MNLTGKSRDQIEKLTRNKTRAELLDLLYEHTTFEPMFKPQEIAERRRMSKRTVVELIHRGILRAHKPFNNGLRVPLWAIRKWDSETAVYFSDTKELDESKTI
jgi:excisionase family DNA binding protein